MAILKSLLTVKPYRVAKFHRRPMKSLVARMLRSDTYGVLWLHHLNSFSYLPSYLGEKALVVLDQQNADELEWMTFTREGNWAIRFFALANLWMLRRFQEKALKRVSVVISVSDGDANFMRRRVPASCEVWTVPNGIDTDHFKPSSPYTCKKSNVIILCGSMDITMNADAAIRFAKDIFPLIKSAVHEAEFWIVGRNPKAEVRKLENIDGILVTGSVEDVRQYYNKAKVAVAPFRYGGGTKLKVLESMAMGIPIVSSDVGAQGIDVTADKHLFIENANEKFAQRVIELLTNDELRQDMSNAARKLVESRYSWPNLISEAGHLLELLLEARREQVG